MKPTMIKAWLFGMSVLAAVFAAWFLLLKMEVFSQFAAIALWVSPLLAGFVASFLGPSHNILLGTSLAIPAALFAVLLNVAPQLSGQVVDFPGLKGALILFTVVLIGSAILAGIGSVAACFVSGKCGRHV